VGSELGGSEPSQNLNTSYGEQCSSPPASPSEYAFADTYHHRDHLGTLRVVTDGSGWVTGRHDFYPFGTEIGGDDGEGSRKRYTGHERDAGTGMDYMLGRYYAFGIGIFTRIDPGSPALKAIGTWNRYSAALANPLILVDPSGFEVTYASDELRQFFEIAANQSQAVRDALALYEGSDNPDLYIGIGETAPDARTGEPSLGAFNAYDIDYTHDYTKIRGPHDIYPKTGANVIIQTGLKAATLTLNESLAMLSDQWIDVALHELGHADHAARDILDYMINGAEDMETNPDGTPMAHDLRPVERVADEFKARATKQLKAAATYRRIRRLMAKKDKESSGEQQ